MISILALDMATITGFAYLSEKVRSSGSVNFKFHPDESLGSRLSQFYVWLETEGYLACRRRQTPDLIVYERSHFRGAGSYLLTGMTSVLNLYAFQVDAVCQPVSSKTLKKFATGNGNASKPDMFEALKKLPKYRKAVLQDDNHVDALWLLEYAVDNCKSWIGEQL